MKKLFFILALAFLGFAATGQTATFNMSRKATTKPVNTNYTLTDAATVWFQWNASKAVPTTQDFQCNIDSVSGDHTNIAITLYGRKFDDDSWTQIGSTVNSTHTATHTVTSIISNTILNRYRQYKSEFVLTGTGVSTLDFQILKLWNE